jgi:hypothetical protein
MDVLDSRASMCAVPYVRRQSQPHLQVLTSEEAYVRSAIARRLSFNERRSAIHHFACQSVYLCLLH